jgi:hypothetical protein
MSIKVRTFPAAEADQLEAKLNTLLSKPDWAGYTVAGACTLTGSSGVQTILLVLQKP